MITLTGKEKQTVKDAAFDHSQGLFGLIERDGYFKGTVPYPNRADFNINRPCTECGNKHENPIAAEDYKNAMSAYHADQNKMRALFKYAALYDCGLEDHPKADKAYEIAWSRGHSSGYYEVLQELEELAELLKD